MTAIYQSRDAAIAVTEQLKIYAQPQRLIYRIFCMVSTRSAKSMTRRRSANPPLSQQLAALCRAGLVETRRVAKQVYYRLANETVIACVRNIEAMFSVCW